MAINPMHLMKLKDRIGVFRNDHPKFISFIKMLGRSNVEEGTILEMKLKTPSGEEHTCNIRLTPEDVKTFRMIFGD